MTVTFAQAGDQTELTVHVELPAALSTDARFDRAGDGWRDTVERLAAALARTSTT